MYIIILNIFEFHEIGLSEGHTLHMYANTVRRTESKDWFSKVCVLCH